MFKTELVFLLKPTLCIIFLILLRTQENWRWPHTKEYFNNLSWWPLENFRARVGTVLREGNGTPLQCSCLEIPWTEEPGRLQSTGSLRVRYNWATSLSLFTFTRWRRKWQPTPVFLPGESQGRGSLVGCRLWGHTESDTTEATSQQQRRDSSYSVSLTRISHLPPGWS